jgi:hypothetical protein
MNFERVRVVLKQPVRVPPVPDDELYVDGTGCVFATFSDEPIAMTAEHPAHVGWLSTLGDQYSDTLSDTDEGYLSDTETLKEEALLGPKRRLCLLSSGDGYSIPCRFA